MCCKIIPVKRGENILVRDGFQIPDEHFFDNLVPLTKDSACKINEGYVKKVQNIFPHVKFYSCRYLDENNQCSLQNKPVECINFPSTALALVPDECSCSGDIFIKNEELKHKIRTIKEEILDYEILIELGDKESVSYRKIIDNLRRFITKYKDFGSEDW